eukprot:7419235-Prorocentrum_lima.AAC.1
MLRAGTWMMTFQQRNLGVIRAVARVWLWRSGSTGRRQGRGRVGGGCVVGGWQEMLCVWEMSVCVALDGNNVGDVEAEEGLW